MRVCMCMGGCTSNDCLDPISPESRATFCKRGLSCDNSKNSE